MVGAPVSRIAKPLRSSKTPRRRVSSVPAVFAWVNCMLERRFAPVVVLIAMCKSDCGEPASIMALRARADAPMPEANGVVPAAPMADEAVVRARVPRSLSTSLTRPRTACANRSACTRLYPGPLLRPRASSPTKPNSKARVLVMVIEPVAIVRAVGSGTCIDGVTSTPVMAGVIGYVTASPTAARSAFELRFTAGMRPTASRATVSRPA